MHRLQEFWNGMREALSDFAIIGRSILNAAKRKDMLMHNLTSADHAHLRFLRGAVDRLQDESFRLDPHPNVKQDLQRARSELKSFIKSLQKEGKNIHG